MLEKHIEQKLVQAVKKASGIAPKLICPGYDGMPDRLVYTTGRQDGFVEVKRPGMKPRPLQIKRHGVLRQLGFKVYVLDDLEQIGGILHEIENSL